ncbi:hypothetical protein [Luteolibacter soli]|uniref:Uncharacterized protein n=1 Tax=Luteolibacter soli TaxID=3135280 RepID=A0ABU9AVS7_9BACT
MFTTRYLALIPLVGLLLSAVEAEEGERAAMRQEAREALGGMFGKASLSINKVAAVEDPSLTRLFPHARFVRTSASVIVDPVTEHGARLEFVIYSHEDTRVVISMSGDRSGFAELCKKADVHLRDENEASQLAMAFAAIYRLGEPMVWSGGGGYLVRFGLSAGGKIWQHGSEFVFRCDEGKKVVEVTETQVPHDLGDADAVSVEKIKEAPREKTNVFALKRDWAPSVSGEEALEVEVPGAALIRIAAVRFGGSKAAVVVQVDEFFLEYREYQLAGKRWELSRKARLRELNGALSLRLKEVEMKRLGEATVRFGKQSLETSVGGWELAVVGRAFPREKDDSVQSFRLEGEAFVEVTDVEN